MNECPHRAYVKVAMRKNFDLKESVEAAVSEKWFCQHPFHGVVLELGDSLADVEEVCSSCALPRLQEDLTREKV